MHVWGDKTENRRDFAEMSTQGRGTGPMKGKIAQLANFAMKRSKHSIQYQ